MRVPHIAVAVFILTATLSTLSAAALDYQLVWSDEFDGSGVDPSKWSFQIGDGCPSLCGWGNNELQYYRAENAIVSGGLLTITAREESFGGRDYTSARMRTIDLGDWKYGRFEMRAQMPVGQGLWPAFWMLPTDNVYGGWAASGEIDIMEYLGQNTDHASGAIHYGGSWPDNVFWSEGYTLPAGSFADSMHDFALEWGPHEMRWYVDGEQYACQSHWYSSNGGYPAPFDQEFHILLNMAVGGYLPGPPDETTSFPQDVVVDHVRVYNRPEFPECEILFDGMDHADPSGANGWFTFDGSVGGGGIGGYSADLPPGGCNAAVIAGYGSGGAPGFFGGFGRTSPRDLTGMTHFSFWINPDAGQDYVIEINLQDDDNGDDAVPGTPDGADDEYQFDCHVSATGPCAIAGGGWQHVSVPLASFFDDNSYHFGGNGLFDPFPVSGGGNGQLVSVVLALVSNSGDDINFKTDKWLFTNESASISGRVWNDSDGNGLPDGGEPGWNGVGVDLLDSTGATLQTTTTAGAGDYQFLALPWGEYTVSVRTATLPAGAFPTTDPDGVGTPHIASALLGCSDTSSAQDFGYGSAPNPTASILVAKSGADLEISYDIECNASDHALLFGSLGDFTTVIAADCSIGSSGSAISTVPAGDVWFLVAGSEAGRYSSVGQSTSGERTPTGIASQCPSLVEQDLGSTCTVD
jgi:beta-glucanase (GH16 family)